MNFNNVTALTINGNSVKQLTIDGKVVWSKGNTDLVFYNYLEGDDVAYINTGYIANYYTKIEFEIYTESTKDKNCLFSSRSAYSTNDVSYYYKANGRDYAQVVFGNRSLNSLFATNNSEIISMCHEEIIVNGVSYPFSGVSSFTCPDNLYLFKNSPSSSYNGTFTGQLKYFKIYDNDVLVRDFVPCTYNGAAGLWDSVNNVFYGNANSSGSFTVG